MLRLGLMIAGGIVIAGAAVFAGLSLYQRHWRSKSEKTALEKAKEEFATHADTFSGLFEPLYLMTLEGSKYRAGVVGDWATRTANLSNAEHYCALCNQKLADSAGSDMEHGLAAVKELLAFVLDSGVCRDTAGQIVVDGNTYKKYGTYDEMIEEGNPAKVKTPYWFIGDKILEKGIIDKM